MTQEEACAALGVRKQTLYAYVSRGQIEVRWDPDHISRKLYRASDISMLMKKRDLGRARKNIAASTMAWGEPIINTHISTIVRGRLYYRGKDAIQLAATATLEETAHRFTPTALVGIYMSRQRGGRSGDITYMRFAFSGTLGPLEPGRALDHGIVRTLWMTADELRASRERHRSPLLLQCVEDYLAGHRHPLDLIHVHASVAGEEEA